MSKMLCPQCWGAKKINAKACPSCAAVGAVDDVQLTPHFALSELVASPTAVRKGIANVPTDASKAALLQLATECLEPIRAQFGPIHINSGLRVSKLNTSIGGSDSSAHVSGYAADFVPGAPGVTLKQIVDFVIASTIPYDQVIYEGTWVHIGRKDASGKKERRQNLMMFRVAGKTNYSTYNANDLRVV